MVRTSLAQTALDARTPSMIPYLNPIRMVRGFWRQRVLIWQFTRREIESRYRGSFLDLFWLLINPLVLLLIYTFIFGVVFHARWGRGPQSLSQFALILFCGLTAFNIFSECVGRASTMVVSVPNYVKKVVFPLEILPICGMGAALFPGLISVGIILVANLLVNHTVQWTLIFLPLVTLPLIFFSLGLAWFLASLGVFLRDINHAVRLILQVLFYASAIFYQVEVLPSFAQTLFRLNPLISIVANFRRVTLWGVLPGWSLLPWLLVTGVVMMLGYAWFMKTKSAFADVI